LENQRFEVPHTLIHFDTRVQEGNGTLAPYID
jgi:hypothetical protein